MAEEQRLALPTEFAIADAPDLKDEKLRVSPLTADQRLVGPLRQKLVGVVALFVVLQVVWWVLMAAVWSFVVSLLLMACGLYYVASKHKKTSLFGEDSLLRQYKNRGGGGRVVAAEP